MSVENRQIPDPRQLPFLLNLLDDESRNVREEIARHLAAFGPALKTELAKLPADVVRPRVMALEGIFLETEREQLIRSWGLWMDEPVEIRKLETALSILADFQSGLRLLYPDRRIEPILDGLAREYQDWAQTRDPLELARFLFQVKRFAGAKTDYYNPQSSNMLYVLHEKRGLPISLAFVYMLVGARVGFVIEGYNAPGHFLAKVNWDGRDWLIDGFNGGAITEGAGEDAPAPVNAVDMVRRVLNNLINAYQAGGESRQQQLMIELYRMIQDN